MPIFKQPAPTAATPASTAKAGIRGGAFASRGRPSAPRKLRRGRPLAGSWPRLRCRTALPLLPACALARTLHSRRWCGWRTALALLLACASATPTAETLKIAALSPEGSVWMNLLREGGAEVLARSDGRVAFKFYPGGVMGDDKAVLRKMRVGQLQGAVLTAGALVQRYPDITLYNLPMIFRSAAEVDFVRRRMDGQLLAGLAAQGLVAFGFAEVGFAYAMSRNPFTSVAGAQAQKVWVPDNDPGAAQALRAFGITPIPLPIVDVLGGLQTGLIDSVAAPPVGAVALQWHTRVAHVLDLPLLYIYGLLVVDKRRFERLAQPDQQSVREVMANMVRRVNARSRQDHEMAAAALANQGLIWHTPSAGEAAQWRELAQQASQRMVQEGYVSGDLHQTLQQHLVEFRAAAGTSARREIRQPLPTPLAGNGAEKPHDRDI